METACFNIYDVGSGTNVLGHAAVAVPAWTVILTQVYKSLTCSRVTAAVAVPGWTVISIQVGIKVLRHLRKC